MKTTIQLLAGMCALFLVACGSDSTTTGSTEASLDSFQAERGSCGPEFKIDEPGPQGYLVCPKDEVVSLICVKAGPMCFCADSDEEGPCYSFEGIGTSSGSVSGGGTGRDCKDISHTQWECEEGPKCDEGQTECPMGDECAKDEVCVEECCEPVPPKCDEGQTECPMGDECAKDEMCVEECCEPVPPK